MADNIRLSPELQITQSGDLTTSGTPGTATTMVAGATLVHEAFFYADAGNSAAISLGPSSTAAIYPVAAGQWFRIAPHSEPGAAVVDLKDWYVKSTAASQTFRLIYT